LREGTITLGHFFGIPLKLHWTFALLIAYVIYIVYIHDSYLFLAYIFFMFLCVVLHEYGHALMARHYSIKTKDIILSPIGGVARLAQLPDKPKQELAIAFAGPLVNLILSILLGVYLIAVENNVSLLYFDFFASNGWTDYIRLAFITNVALFALNLIPAFPMDGGRVLRALLAIRMGKSKATMWASRIGRVLAVGFVLIGIYDKQYMFAIIGVIIFIMAGAESRDVQLTEKLAITLVKDFMRIDFTKLHIGDKMAKAFDILKRNGETNFLVYDSLGYIVGSLPAHFITVAAQEDKLDESCNQWMSDKVNYILQEDHLKHAFDIMNENGSALLAVNDDSNQVVGVIDREAINRALIMMQP
jgi:Zn-dependent protease